MPRPSPVTDEVRKLLQSGGRHAWSLEELLEGVRGSLGGADYSSVFRATVALEQAGVIDRLELGDGRSHFELHEDHHEHVRCQSCGKVAEIRGCVADDAEARIQASTGYVINGHQIVFIGLCPACAEGAATPQ
ncbi:MAG TPA: transcriptional repressor [Candidatus Dormibacteraeota bacterium]|nr:transcriptional repressor [Candidatus Dormibacteraeota bacterium]